MSMCVRVCVRVCVCACMSTCVCVSVCVLRQLSKIQFDFQTLSETTVIMLHLEVRSHCFFYLQPALHKVSTQRDCALHQFSRVYTKLSGLKN